MEAAHMNRYAIALAIIAASTAIASGAYGADAQRQADVAQRGAQVMPFDLSATKHVFTKTADGGVQRVIA
jgi:hypothetical protein